MPHRGFIGLRIKRKDDYSILRGLRDYFKVDTFKDIIPKIELVIKERDKLLKEIDRYKKKTNSILKEFGNKKIGSSYMKIRKRGKRYPTKKQGVLYFNKNCIGKRVIVWEKK